MNLLEYDELMYDLKRNLENVVTIYHVDTQSPFDISMKYAKYRSDNNELTVSSNGGWSGLYVSDQLHNYFVTKKQAELKQRARKFDERAKNNLTLV